MYLASHTNILSSAAKFVCSDEKSKFNAMTRNHIFWLTDSDRFCDPMILGQHPQINLTQIFYQRYEVYILSTWIYNFSLNKQENSLKILSWLRLGGIFNRIHLLHSSRIEFHNLHLNLSVMGQQEKISEIHWPFP